MREKKLILAGLAAAALAAVGLVVWARVAPGPKLLIVRSGIHGIPAAQSDPHPTIVEARPGTLVVRRPDEKGDLLRLGEHPRAENENVRVVDGLGACYGLHRAGSLRNPRADDVRVYDAGKELYAVPRALTRWGARSIAPIAVLAGGHLLVAYRHRGGMEPPPFPDPILLRIIVPHGGSVRWHDLVSTPTEAWRLAISGDGSVVAVSLGERPSPAAVRTRTVFFAANDGRQVRAIDGFAVSWLSHDGQLAVGNKTNASAVYRGTECVTERPCNGIRVLRPSADGRYTLAFGARGPHEVMTTESLNTVYQVAPRPPYEVADSALAPDGRLAAYECDRKAPGGIRSWLTVYGLDGDVLLTRDLGTTKGWAVRSPAWSKDGKVLVFVNERQDRVVRVRP